MSNIKLVSKTYLIFLFSCFTHNSYAIDAWHVDQDLFAPGNQDRNYTMGILFDWYGDNAVNHPLSSLTLLKGINSYLGIDNSGTNLYTVSFGGSAFTPDDLHESDVIDQDRPYASLLYAGTTITNVKSEEDERSQRLAFAILGLGIANYVQTEIHVVSRKINKTDQPYNPEGWSHQISNGGEPTFLYQASRFKRIKLDSEHWDAAYSIDGSLGYYTNTSFGGALKWGTFSKVSPFSNMITDMNPQSDISQIKQLFVNRRIAENYVTFGLRARLIGYNELLQCGFRKSDLCISGGDIERVVYEGSLGFSHNTTDGNRYMFSCNRRSAEHKRAERRGHNWCGINVYFIP